MKKLLWILPIGVIAFTIYYSYHKRSYSPVSKAAIQQVSEQRSYHQAREIYAYADSLLSKDDTLIIMNSKYDTTIIETGIISYLFYRYPDHVPFELATYVKNAMAYESGSQILEANSCYLSVVDYYRNEHKRNLQKFSCTNGYLAYNVNSGILYSYAFEKLGDIDNALEVLMPYMANIETRSSKIKQRYIELCLKKYGRDKVITALDSASTTICISHVSPLLSGVHAQWAFLLFNADIGFMEFDDRDLELTDQELLVHLDLNDYYAIAASETSPKVLPRH